MKRAFRPVTAKRMNQMKKLSRNLIARKNPSLLVIPMKPRMGKEQASIRSLSMMMDMRRSINNAPSAVPGTNVSTTKQRNPQERSPPPLIKAPIFPAPKPKNLKTTLTATQSQRDVHTLTTRTTKTTTTPPPTPSPPPSPPPSTPPPK